MKKFLFFVVLPAIMVAGNSCKKLSWEKDSKARDCYCVYYFRPGVERYETFKYGPSYSDAVLKNICNGKDQEFKKKYGYYNAHCDVK
ncbi:hypothetical protein GCM10023093_24550 [Nemorincola caseinilytica]|uniref:Lipoprotein n=1 Tax=Nemorincola caseinilytica TaxID=2054315 RepID=A0ABP8NLR4_9BACT